MSLHSRDKTKLLANGEGVLHSVGLILGVEAVRCVRCTEDGREERGVVSEDLSNSAGHSDVPLSTEVVLDDAGLVRTGVWEQENIVLL